MQVYKEDGSVVLATTSPLFDKPVVIRTTEYEEWVIDGIVRQAEQEGTAGTKPTMFEVAQAFGDDPEIMKSIRSLVKEKVDDIKQEIKSLQEDDQEQQSKQALNQITRDELAYRQASNEAYRTTLQEKKQGLEMIVNFAGKGKKAKALQDFTLAIEKAKQYPIDQLLPFKRKVTPCLWHPDTDPSLHYYRKKNRVHCFVCDQGWDAIDVTQKLHDCSFKEAVSILNNQ
jgi:hypothetical protein